MAEFKIDGRMTVRTLKENFKKEFEGTLRVYNGRELADESATLAAIRTGDAKGGELVCRASRTVGKFEQEMMEVFGIKVQVASPDDWVLVLDGVTLANLKNIPKQARKADMESLVAYKRKVSQIESDSNNEVKDTSGKVLLNSKYKNIPFIDFKFNKIDWELNEDNIEAHREEFDGFGVIYVKAGEDDFDVVVITTCDIADGLYDALDEVEHFIDEGCEFVEVYYTTVWEMYGVAKSYDYADVSGHVLSSLAFCEDNNYDYDLNSPVLCRAIWDDRVQVWLTDKWGDHEDELELNNEINLLIEYKKDPNSVADKIEWQGPKLQCFNINGEFVFEILGDSYVGKMCSNGLINVEIDRKKGFINKKGEEVIPCKYDYVGSFATNGLAYVEIDGKYGFVNENGEEVIPCKYDNADSFAANGFAYVRIDDKYGFINENGEEVIPCKYDDVGSFASNGLAYVEIDGKYGFINENGEEVIPCKYDYVGSFAINGLADVEIDGKYGFINEKGEEVIPCKYDGVYEFSSNGLAEVEIDGKYGFINEKGEEVIPCKYDRVWGFSSNGLIHVEIDGKKGFINKKGEEVIPCKYDYVGSFATNGLAYVEIDGKYGFVNESGEEVIPCKYDNAGSFATNGLAKVKLNGKYGFINEEGEEVIPCKYEYVDNFEASGLTYVEMGGKYGCINSKDEEVIPCNYSKVNIIEDLIFVKNN